MAFVLLNGCKIIAKQPARKYYVCGCKQLYSVSSINNDDDNGNYTKYKYLNRNTNNRTVLSRSQNTGVKWAVSGLHSQSLFLHSSSLFIDLNLYEEHIFKRLFHSSAYLSKEDTVVEKSLKNLKEKEKEKSSKDKVKLKEPVPVPEKQNVVKAFATKIYAKWLKFIKFLREEGIVGVGKHLYHEFLFYKDGMKLFWKDLRICIPLSYKYLKSGRSTLTRREYRLLKQTLVDLLLMFPILPTLIIPCMEVLIPVFMYIGMIPKVFISKEARETQISNKLQRKIESAKLLVESLHDMPLKAKSKKDDTVSSVQEFTDFMKKVKSSEVIPPISEILKFSRLFENTLTLDDLSIKQLQGLCKLLGIGFLSDIPNARVLRFQIETRMRELTVDDKFILRDGIDSLTTEELQAANRARGMRALGVSEERLKIQLEHWLELHLKERVPTSLLLLSRVMYLDENLSPAEQLRQTISSLPETTVDKAKVTSAESSGESVDKATKIKVLEEESKAIKLEKEAAAEEERLAKEKEKMEKQQEEERKAEEEKRKLAELTLQKMDNQNIIDELAFKFEKEREKRIDTPIEAEPVPETVKEPVDSAQDITEDVKPVVDTAEPIVEQPSEEKVDKAEKIEDEDNITAKDLGDIEKAIEDQAKHYKDELAEVAEDLDEYKEDVEDIKALCLKSDLEKDIEETWNAKLLLKRMDKVLKQFDTKISKLQDEKIKIQENIDKQEVSLKYDLDGKSAEIMEDISAKKKNLVSINDVLLSLKRFQKVPDDVRMQKVLEVLDTDKDGLIDINHVLKVTEVLGRENLKMNKSQVAAMMDLVAKEEVIEQEEKKKEKEEKEKEQINEDEKSSKEQTNQNSTTS